MACAARIKRIVVRALLLFALGVVFSGGLRNGWEQVRWLGVLQRIGICYAVTAILFCTLRTRALAAVCAAILIGYWGLLTFVPIRDINLQREPIAQLEATTGASAQQLFDRTTTWVTGAHDNGRNLAHHLDFQLLPGRKYDGHYDPEGLLSTLPGIASCLLGVFAGLLLQRRSHDREGQRRLVVQLAAGGGVALLLGWLWGLHLPINKQLWTPAYVLYAAGWSALLLALFYQVIEVWGYRRWAVPLIWIGMNPIAIYLARNFCDFNALAERLVGGPIKGAFGPYGPLLVISTGIALSILFVWYLHRRRIFLRL